MVKTYFNNNKNKENLALISFQVELRHFYLFDLLMFVFLSPQQQN